MNPSRQNYIFDHELQFVRTDLGEILEDLNFIGTLSFEVYTYCERIRRFGPDSGVMTICLKKV